VRTLKGVENIGPAPRVPHFLPAGLARRSRPDPFRFDSHKESLPKEQFNYTAHLCCRLQRKKTFGVVLVTYASSRGAPKDIHFSRPWPIPSPDLQRKTLLNACRKDHRTQFSF